MRRSASAGASDPGSRPPGTAGRSAASTRWSRSSLSGTPSAAPPAPGRNRAPTSTVPGGRVSDTGPVSGPATNAPAPLCQIRSVHPSGSTRVSDVPGVITETHRQWISFRNATPGANSR